MAKQGMRNVECSVFVGNLDQRVTEEILWELLLQAGPIKSIHIPCEQETGKQRAYAFVEFTNSASAHFAWELLDGIKLYNRPLTVRPQNSERGEPPPLMPSNAMPASVFYNEFYKKYEEVNRRPQSEPRRDQWSFEDSSHQRNNSFSHPSFNRSLSSPAYMVNTSPQLQQLLNMFPHNRINSMPYHASPSQQTPPQYSGSSHYSSSPPFNTPPFTGSTYPRQNHYRR